MAEYIERTEELMLAMNAGARAIENTKRYHGVVYTKGLFSENPKEIPYLRAVKVLREASDAPAADVAPVVHGKKVADAPTVDAVVVTRCKDCKHLCVWNRKDIYAFCPKTNIVFLPFDKDTRTFFCSYGKRKPSADG